MGVRRYLGQVFHEMPISAHQVLPPTSRRALRRLLRRYNPWEEEYDFTPPAPRPGEVVGPPDWVGIGVQKAGTSWWFDLINAHPDSAGPIPGPVSPVQKERHFFTRFATAPFDDASVAQYHAWFPRPAGKRIGEWTPDYLYYPWVPPLLARAAPEAKLLVILRDPVERFRSGLTHELNLGTGGFGVTIAGALGHGFYAEQLKRWFETFKRDQVLVLQYERCAADPGGQLARTYEFLGMDPYVPAHLEQPVHQTPGKKLTLDAEVRRRLVDCYRADVAELFELLPELDPALWPQFTS